MSCSFPLPQEVPTQVKQTVMNHVFPKRTSLLKRSLLIKVSSFSLFGILVLISWLYIKTSLVSPTFQVQQIDSDQNIQTLSVSSADLIAIENSIAETEKVLSELESLI